MKTFLTLFKFERRSLFPSFSLKKKPDIIGGLLSLSVSALVVALFLYMISTVAEHYVILELNKVSDPISRSAELLTILYLITIAAVAILCLEKMRNTLTSKVGKDIFLRLPVSSKTMFFSKLSALMLWNYITSICFIVPINAIFYMTLKPGVEFFIDTALVVLFLPTISFFIATILLLPYIGIINFLSRHYFITLIVLSGMLVGAFFAYSEFLDVVRTMFETGSIQFLFNARFINFLQKMQEFAYPANLLADLALGEKNALIFGVLMGAAVISFVTALLVTNSLYTITLYKTRAGKTRSGRRHVRRRRPLFALMRKEFITVFRNPKNLFAYFSIALAMPFMIYCCYTLFETLLNNAIGGLFDFELSLTLVVLLVFGTLTNTFCSTNISRDGKAALKAKIFPMKGSTILLSKVLFCNLISSLSVIATGAFLWFKAGISLKNAIIAVCVGLVFSLSQILIATRMDLNHARVAASPAETEKASNRTIAKTITAGLLLAIITSFLSLFASAFSGIKIQRLGGLKVLPSYSYLIPIVIAVLYLIISFIYCFTKVEKAFNKLVR